MKIVIDMNLSPDWVRVFQKNGWEAVHWINVGNIQAPDREIMAWALTHDYVIFTHDLDFSALLAVSQATKPSVIQIRGQNTLPIHLEASVVSVINQFQELLAEGALITLDEVRARVRVLPLRR